MLEPLGYIYKVIGQLLHLKGVYSPVMCFSEAITNTGERRFYFNNEHFQTPSLIA